MKDEEGIHQRYWFASNVLTASEVAELLHVTRQHVSVLNNTGKLQAIKDTKQGRLYLRNDVEDYKHRTNKQEQKTIYKFLGVGDPNVFLENKIYGKTEVQAALIYSNGTDAVLDNFYDVRPEFYGTMQLVSAPTMILRFTNGEEFWTSFASCGYQGAGPQRAHTVLLECGFSEEEAQLVFANDIVKLVRDGAGNTDLYAHENGYLHDHASANSTPNIAWRDGHLIMHPSVASNPALESDSLVLYQRFLPNPSHIMLLTPEQAEDYGCIYVTDVQGSPAITRYTVIIKDVSGRELWLAPAEPIASEDDSFNNVSLKEVLRRCGYDLSEISENLKGWILHFLSRQMAPDEKPFVIRPI